MQLAVELARDLAAEDGGDTNGAVVKSDVGRIAGDDADSDKRFDLGGLVQSSVVRAGSGRGQGDGNQAKDGS